MEYRLEYKSETGHFHLDNYSHEENTNGYITIKKSITDEESKLFFDFIEYGFPFKIKKYTNNQVLGKIHIFNQILNLKQNEQKEKS